MLRQCENLVPEISKTSYRYVFIVLRLYSNSTDWQVHKCAIPVFEGLLPKKHDGIVRRLLFELSTWHGLAKLRLHTETTVKDLEHSTARLGNILREFKKRVCSAYKTTELPSEEAARVRRKASAAKKLDGQPTQSMSKVPSTTQTAIHPCRYRTFNLNTYKIHSLGHYARAIRLYGTADNYTSQTVSIKLLYSLLANGLWVK
jgi:hypothetical protein